MLRSLAYATAAAQSAVRPGPDAAEHAARIAAYGNKMSSVFSQAYSSAIHGCAAYPDSREAADQLLRLFLFEKALYEVAYELANRPDWVQIPLRGVLELMAERA